MTAVESLLAMRFSGAESFDDHVAEKYVTEKFGEEAWKEYLELVPSSKDLFPLVSAGAWKASPLSTGLSLSRSILPGGEEFIYGRHIRLMSDLIVDAAQGRGKRFLAFAMPYRHSKSITNSVVTAIWLLANFPWMRVGLTAHSDSLSTRFARMVREAIRSNSGKLGFGLKEDQQSVHEFKTDCGGEIWQRSMAGNIQGIGCDALLVDDPFGSPEDAASAVQREKVWDFFFSALSRVENEGIIILCTTRWWADDLYGRLESGYADTDPSQWNFVSLPAIYEGEGIDAVGRKKGEALWPVKRTLAELESLKRSMPASAWERGYQQRPMDELGIHKCYNGYAPERNDRDAEWDFMSPVHVGVDFNCDPMSAEMFMCQKYMLPGWTNQFSFNAQGLDELLLETSDMSVFAEALTEKLAGIARGAKMSVRYSYDATSNRRVAGLKEGDTALRLLKRELLRCKRPNITASWHDASTNPSVFTRVDFVNEALKEGRLTISRRQKELRKDFQGVFWKFDMAGNRAGIDKARDAERSHASDAAGYALMAFGGPQEFCGEVAHGIPGITH